MYKLREFVHTTQTTETTETTKARPEITTIGQLFEMVWTRVDHIPAAQYSIFNIQFSSCYKTLSDDHTKIAGRKRPALVDPSHKVRQGA